MSVERSGPAICNVSNIGEGKDEMTKASDDLQDLRRRIYVKARLNRRGGGWKRGMVEIVGHSQTKGRDNREPKLRPKPARRSSTLPEGGEAKSLPYPYRIELKPTSIQISISVPNSTTCRVGTPKNAAERS